MSRQSVTLLAKINNDVAKQLVVFPILVPPMLPQKHFGQDYSSFETSIQGLRLDHHCNSLTFNHPCLKCM